MVKFLKRIEPVRGDETHFENREKYLQFFDPQHRNLCTSIEGINKPITGETEQSMQGFPWITVVLGSGCLSEDSDARIAVLGTNAARMTQSLLTPGYANREFPPDRVAMDFATSIIRDRLAREAAFEVDIPFREESRGSHDAPALPERQAAHVTDPQQGDEADPQQDAATAKLLFLTALLTRFYYRVRGGDPVSAVSRYEREIARLNPGENEDIFRALRLPVLEPADVLLDELTGTFRDLPAETQQVDGVVAKVLTNIKTSFSSTTTRKLSAVDLQVLTELCWFRLTLGTSVYPGWSDLLMYLSMAGFHYAFDRRQLRPAFVRLSDATEPIRERYKQLTTDSWEERGELSDRSKFYSTIARMLAAQSGLQDRPKQDRPPIASAFVATFDLELEMAFLSLRQPFLMALPVTVSLDTSPYGHFCWLGCVVDPKDADDHQSRLGLLTNPKEGAWFVLSEQARFEESARSNLPVVVRLSGSPLIELPDGNLLDGSDADVELARNITRFLVTYSEDEEVKPRTVSLAHDVLIDEYSSMHQAVFEFYDPSFETTDDRIRIGLPVGITSVSNTNTASRYWMMMGVQVGDPGIRARLAAQLMAPSLLGKEPSALRRGVVVNSRIDASGRDLLRWYGLDVVTDRCQAFQDDLEHYIKHLEAAPDDRATPNENCRLR